jgi:hypothetical protein
MPRCMNLRATAVALGSSLLGACAVYGYGGYGDVAVAPPEPIVEAPAPRVGFIWAPGYYVWGGGRYSWRAGHYIRERPGHRWVADRWERRGNRWHYARGHFD